MSRVSSSLAALLLSVSLLAPVQAEPPPEPTIREVLRMALRAARSLGPERTRELCRRARLAGLVPTLKLSAQRGLQQDLSSSQSLETDRTNSSQGDDLSLEASLSFELSRLVFASEEVRVLSVERWLVADRRRLIEEVTRLYFQRQRLVRERATAAAPDAELDTAIAEAEALLDAFTEGGFSRAPASGTKR
jgi:outer membrane protein TolC